MSLAHGSKSRDMPERVAAADMRSSPQHERESNQATGDRIQRSPASDPVMPWGHRGGQIVHECSGAKARVSDLARRKRSGTHPVLVKQRGHETRGLSLSDRSPVLPSEGENASEGPGQRWRLLTT